jgi:hypothetical protein
VTGRKIVLKIAARSAEFSGDLAGRTLTGQSTEGGKSTPVTWTREP